MAAKRVASKRQRFEYRVAGPTGWGEWHSVNKDHVRWYREASVTCSQLVQVREVLLARLTRPRLLSALIKHGMVDEDTELGDDSREAELVDLLADDLGVPEYSGITEE